ncbi:protein translocase subunit SecD [Candidatus Gracilibacteria bacterium]|nr:protein translocase subunit SecD [Candidatus Gracilibacteria bacterium]
MNITHRVLIIVALIILSGLYIVPWNQYGVDNAFLNKPYTLGLDLQGGVELDYKVDLDTVRSQSGTNTEQNIVEGIKSVIDKRVNSLGLAEPTIQTAKYGSDNHIIVQIPTQAHADLSDTERKIKNAEDIKKAKETIGKVVQLEFREEKTGVTEADRAERRSLAEKALVELKTTPFATIGQKYRDSYENVAYSAGTGALPKEVSFSGIEAITTFPYVTPVFVAQGEQSYTKNASGEIVATSNPGYAIVELQSKNAVGTGATYNYSFIFIDQRPSPWQAAKTADGKVLNDKYLINSGVGFTQVGQPQVELLFNEEGKKIFGELTKRLIGKQIAIFVGGQLLTAPTVQAVITDGKAVITGEYTIKGAQTLANDINTGIVPAPIYLTSERTIDAKIGSESLRQILMAGAIGLFVIIIFLTVSYRVSGLLAGLALITYTLILIALVKMTGVVLTLASIAGVILSIGLAIDANILIFERMREALGDGKTMDQSITLGFEKSWTAIWDSHITSLTSAVILYIFGISLIKGFGFMLGLGIILSLFTAMWVSRILIIAVGRKIGKNSQAFIGFKK